jgi:hypothetical protein
VDGRIPFLALYMFYCTVTVETYAFVCDVTLCQIVSVIGQYNSMVTFQHEIEFQLLDLVIVSVEDPMCLHPWIYLLSEWL